MKRNSKKDESLRLRTKGLENAGSKTKDKAWPIVFYHSLICLADGMHALSHCMMVSFFLSLYLILYFFFDFIVRVQFEYQFGRANTLVSILSYFRLMIDLF